MTWDPPSDPNLLIIKYNLKVTSTRDDEDVQLTTCISGMLTITKFLPVSFLHEIIYLSGGQMYDPLVGETLFSFVPPSNSFVSVWDP